MLSTELGCTVILFVVKEMKITLISLYKELAK